MDEYQVPAKPKNRLPWGAPNNSRVQKKASPPKQQYKYRPTSYKTPTKKTNRIPMTARDKNVQESDDEEGWINIKELQKENMKAQKKIAEIINYGQFAANAGKKVRELENEFKKKVEQVVPSDKFPVHATETKQPSRDHNKSQISTLECSVILAYKNNLENIKKLNKKKEVEKKYTEATQAALENAIDYYERKEYNLEHSPIKTGRVEGMSSTDILKYHQMKLQKAKLLHVEQARKQNRENLSRFIQAKTNENFADEYDE